MGTLYDPDGFNAEKMAFGATLGRNLDQYPARYPNAKFLPGQKPWQFKCDIALPCATQNELEESDAKALVANGCICVAEGANMPSTAEAIKVFLDAKISFAPGKAANAGGVAVSGLEMSQNSIRTQWCTEEVDNRLKTIMESIHETCLKYGQDSGFVNYLKGANIGGFIKVANAMKAQGIV